MNRQQQVWIGTSNVVMPGNKTSFPPEFQSGSRLKYYATLLNEVEINSSFYKTPMLKTCRRWAEEVPDDFRFTVKLSKEITHARELNADLSLIPKFINSVNGIGKKKGCLLVQFPGKITIDYFTGAEAILQDLQVNDPGNEWKKVVEFRHPGWYIAETWEMLDQFQAAMVLHDHPKAKSWNLRGHANHVYLRFHGPKGNYRESYSDKFLRAIAKELQQWRNEGKEIYCSFNNTVGSAYHNATFLKSLLVDGHV